MIKDPDYIRGREAMRIVVMLQEWIENHDGFASIPIAHVIWSKTGCEIKIGNVTVWNSDNDEDGELTFEFCRASYLADLRNLLPFIEKPA